MVNPVFSIERIILADKVKRNPLRSINPEVRSCHLSHMPAGVTHELSLPGVVPHGDGSRLSPMFGLEFRSAPFRSRQSLYAEPPQPTPLAIRCRWWEFMRLPARQPCCPRSRQSRPESPVRKMERSHEAPPPLNVEVDPRTSRQDDRGSLARRHGVRGTQIERRGSLHGSSVALASIAIMVTADAGANRAEMCRAPKRSAILAARLPTHWSFGSEIPSRSSGGAMNGAGSPNPCL